MIVEFDSFEVDTEAFELRQAGRAITMEPQVFEVLAYLVANAGRLVPKEELLDEIWGDRFVSESALTSRIKTARKALGDDGRRQHYIKTVHGKGYRFDGVERPVDKSTDGGALPAERTPLFGREEDIDEIGAALGEERLVSLLGVGGAGKTRLAIAAARSVASRFDDGVCFIDLVPIEHGEEIDGALAAAAGLAIGPGSTRAQIVSLLAQRNVLIILDNVEHLVEEVAAVLDALLEGTTAPRFLVTSRVPVELVDERRFLVEPLPVVGEEGPAVDLFVRSARRFGAIVQESQYEQAAEVCRFLDGIPLALELAAAQLQWLDLAALAERLENRLELLVRTTRQPDRHASLLAVLDDTLANLSEDERELLVIVSTFPASFAHEDLDGVLERVVGLGGDAASVPTLRRLLDFSLIVRERGARSRFRLLETVKLRVRESSDPDQRRRAGDGHADWCLHATAGGLSDGLFSFALSDWCASHMYDLRAAERHLALAGRTTEAAELVAATAFAMHCDSGPRAAETLQRLDSVVETVDDAGLIARLRFVGVMCGMATRAPAVIDEQGRLALQAAEESGSRLLLSHAGVLRSWTVVFEDPEHALELTVAAAADADAVGDTAARAFADSYRAFMLALARRYDEAAAIARELIENMTPQDRGGYPFNVALAAFNSILYLSNSDETLALANDIMSIPSREHPMWANQLVGAALFGAAGRRAECRDACLVLHDRLEGSGHTAFPDLLIPIAALAARTGEPELSKRWVRAVRNSPHPTQSFQATVLYRRLREELEADDPTFDAVTPFDMGVAVAEGLAWLLEG
jgi:predicted ATPase/DNA-binding winged helix-turn-helix (wHTH) protein